MQKEADATSGTTETEGMRDIPVLRTEQMNADAHGMFRRYRTTHGVVKQEAGGYYQVLRYSDVDRLFKDPRIQSSGVAYPKIQGVTEGALFDIFQYGMLTADGEVHRRRRSPFSKAFAARLMAEMRPTIRRSAEELVESWHANGQVEFIGQFASLLPARVISGLLGLSQSDIPVFTGLVYEVTRFFSLGIKEEELPSAELAAQQLRVFVENTLEDRRHSPRDDFLSTFLAAVDESAEMSPLEIIFQIVQLIIGGTDTTRVAIVMQVALLLQHRSQWEAVCRAPDLIPAAVAEAMRFEPSVASSSRVTVEDIKICDDVVPAGQFLSLSTMSAMRDEQAYVRPDVFDIFRTDQPRLHPIFGGGVHRCIGEALARIELEESLAVLTARIPHLWLERAPVIKGYSGIRRVDHGMHLSWPK